MISTNCESIFFKMRSVEQDCSSDFQAFSQSSGALSFCIVEGVGPVLDGFQDILLLLLKQNTLYQYVAGIGVENKVPICTG